MKKRARFGWFTLVLLLLLFSSSIALTNCAAFGGSPGGELLQRIEASPQYRDGQFVNVVAQTPASLGNYWRYFIAQFRGQEQREPPSPIPLVPLQANAFMQPAAPGMRAAWLGHASVLFEIDGLRVMVDPVFSERVSPIAFAGPKRFHATPIALQDLPPIDAVLISHDHYDHLDMPTIQYLAERGSRFFVPLGVGAHLQRWGVAAAQVHDMQWWQSISLGAVTLVCTPARHYSGRDMFDYKQTLWSSWSVLGSQHRIYYSGDSGYASHFDAIGQRFGPFDLTLIKVGAYGPSDSWRDIHMSPEQAVQAHMQLRGATLLPVHWATFNLALHAWDEPIKRTLRAAEEHGVKVITPRVGELFEAGQPFLSQQWWEAL